jgi:hypothetical protein
MIEIFFCSFFIYPCSIVNQIIIADYLRGAIAMISGSSDGTTNLLSPQSPKSHNLIACPGAPAQLLYQFVYLDRAEVEKTRFCYS